MATVYLAEDLKHQRKVALKVLRPELAYSVGAERFLREIVITAGLHHPNILPLYDSGRTPDASGGHVYYVMPFVEGESLRDRLAREKQLPVEEALRLTRQVAEALGYAHGEGIIHRDIKPENILLVRGHAVVADFGIARAVSVAGTEKMTQTGLSVGTPLYMSPEQAAGDADLDGRSDLYSLGLVLYELLVGEPPYTGPTPQAIAAKRITQPVPSARQFRESVPPRVDQVLQRLLAKSPADRFASAAEVVAELAKPDSAGITLPATNEVAGPERRSRRLAVAVSLVILAGALAGTGIARLRARGSRPLDPAAVAVLPFRITAPDHSLDYLGEGIVDLLAVKLTGPAGPHAVPPRQLLSYLRYRPGMEVSAEAGQDAARRAGAGLLLDGSLVRSGTGVELSAELRPTDGRGRPVRASVRGAVDSLAALVDGLAAELLVGQSQSPTTVLGGLSTARAISEYLQGKAAHRRGRYMEAVGHFRAALDEDSTFALAALEDIASENRADRAGLERATRLAWASRAKLNAKGQALLRAYLGPKYPEPSSMILGVAAWQEAVQTAPDVADAWFELGDNQLHFGLANDLVRPVESAVGNFGRALELDSTFVMPLDHLLMAKWYLEDTTDLRRLAGLWFAQDTASGDRSDYMRWRLATVLGDSGALTRERARFDRWQDESLAWITMAAQADAVGLGDIEPALRERERRAVAGPRLREIRMLRRTWLLNTGRPAAALALTDSLESGEPSAASGKLRRIQDALFWDGDTTIAAREVAALTEASRSKRSAAAGADDVQARTACRLGLWAVGHGAEAGVREWSGRLRASKIASGTIYTDDDRLICADLLEAWLALRQGRPEARRLVDRADSIMIFSDVAADWEVTDLVTAQLREALGDLPGARRAIGRRYVEMPVSPDYQSTYLREEARLGLLAGDTTTAVRALRRYISLRSYAEPALRPELDRARVQLAQLLGR